MIRTPAPLTLRRPHQGDLNKEPRRAEAVEKNQSKKTVGEFAPAEYDNPSGLSIYFDLAAFLRDLPCARPDLKFSGS